jgi:hypothetical protein
VAIGEWEGIIQYMRANAWNRSNRLSTLTRHPITRGPALILHSPAFLEDALRPLR